MRTRFGKGTRHLRALLLTAALVGALGSGCMKRELKPLNPCLVSGVAATVAVAGVDKVDLLFAVDNSPSMKEEQLKLQDELPKLIQTLVSGMRSDGSTFPAAKDLHLGVITTDMGVPGLSFPPSYNCDDFGDDAELQRASGATEGSCVGQTLPTEDPFITYRSDSSEDPESVAARFGCIAQVGGDGCGYEMQLEAILKALWPHDDDRITFLVTPDPDDERLHRFGQGGDMRLQDPATGEIVADNAGFLRNNAAEGISLIAVVLVTDEEDCSSRTVRHLQASNYSAEDAYLEDVFPNLRCWYHKDRTTASGDPYLHGVDRYVTGLQALRADSPNLVIFAAIAGVPPDLVDANALATVDFEDDVSRQQFYDNLLSDGRMQEVVDGENLRDACEDQAEPVDGATRGGAKPARRIVETVAGFGANGVIQSICQENYERAIDSIIEVIAKQLGAVCLPRNLVRQSDGTVGCNVIWELPNPSDLTAPTTPKSCADAQLNVPENSAAITDDGRARCEVPQLPIMNGMVPAVGEEGWYYDDFSDELKEQCRGENSQRIAFTTNPPNGVTVQLECLNETQSVPQTRTDINSQYYSQTGISPPSIGTPCNSMDSECSLQLMNGEAGGNMFCHRERNTCVQVCSSDTDCPAAWVCDYREDQIKAAAGDDHEVVPICVNPTCGTE